MILDKPKRRCETMVGTLWVNNSETPKDRVKRLERALAEVKAKYEICGSVKVGWLANDHHLSLECSVTITAVIHREPLESRWARALDMIRDQYGLEIEWKRGEVRERTAKRSAAWLTHVTPFHEAYDPPKRVMYSPKSGDWEDVHNTVPPVEESFGPLTVATTGEWQNVDIDVGGGKRLTGQIRGGSNSTLTIGSGEGKPTPKSYADTPTGTVEWGEKKGRLIAYSLGNQAGPKEYHFRDALHLVHDEDHTKVICPVCGVYSGAALWLRHVSSFDKPATEHVGRDAYCIGKMMDGIECTNCNTHLKYDFEAETVTMRRGNRYNCTGI